MKEVICLVEKKFWKYNGPDKDEICIVEDTFSNTVEGVTYTFYNLRGYHVRTNDGQPISYNVKYFADIDGLQADISNALSAPMPAGKKVKELFAIGGFANNDVVLNPGETFCEYFKRPQENIQPLIKKEYSFTEWLRRLKLSAEFKKKLNENRY